MLWGKVKSDNDVQPWKTWSPKVVTPSASTTFTRLVMFLQIPSGIVVPSKYSSLILLPVKAEPALVMVSGKSTSR